MKIRCERKSFPGSGPFIVANGVHDMTVGWHDLVWAAVTVGRKNWRAVKKHGVHSWFEMVYRVGLLWANLQVNPKGRLVRSSAYDALDQSEKGAISYFLGMTLSKAFADKELAVRWLVHMSAFTNGAHLSPDLIGFRRKAGVRDWVVVESKGRTKGLRSKLVSDAVAQAKGVPPLFHNGASIAPSLSIAAITYFSGSTLQMYLQDPETEAHGDRVEVDISRFVESYYGPLRNLLESGRFDRQRRRARGQWAQMAVIEELDVEIGLAEDLMDEKSVEAYLAFSADEPPVKYDVEAGDDQGVVMYDDGVVVRLGNRWNDEVMALDPERR